MTNNKKTNDKSITLTNYLAIITHLINKQVHVCNGWIYTTINLNNKWLECVFIKNFLWNNQYFVTCNGELLGKVELTTKMTIEGDKLNTFVQRIQILEIYQPFEPNKVMEEYNKLKETKNEKEKQKS